MSDHAIVVIIIECFMIDVLKQLELERQNLSDLEARMMFATSLHDEVSRDSVFLPIIIFTGHSQYC